MASTEERKPNNQRSQGSCLRFDVVYGIDDVIRLAFEQNFCAFSREHLPPDIDRSLGNYSLEMGLHLQAHSHTCFFVFPLVRAYQEAVLLPDVVNNMSTHLEHVSLWQADVCSCCNSMTIQGRE